MQQNNKNYIYLKYKKRLDKKQATLQKQLTNKPRVLFELTSSQFKVSSVN